MRSHSHTDPGHTKVNYDEESPRVGGVSYGETALCSVKVKNNNSVGTRGSERVRSTQRETDGARSAAIPPDSVS